MIRLSTADAGFASDFAALVNARREADADVARDVAAIVARVRNEGDAADGVHAESLGQGRRPRGDADVA